MAPRKRYNRPARRIQRAWRRYRKRRYHRKPGKSISSKTGILTCYQNSSEEIPIPSSAFASFTAGQLIFRLNNLDPTQYGNFTRLFKFYRILGVKVTFVPQYIGQTGAPAGEPQPQMLCAGNLGTSITLDSNLMSPVTPVWPDLPTAEACGNLKRKWLIPQTAGKSTKVVKFVPRMNNWVRTSASSSTNATATIAKKHQWVSSQTTGQEYFGLRYYWEQPFANPGMTLEIRTQYLLQFKGVY